MFGRNGDAHVHVVHDELPFHNRTLFLPCEFVEYLPSLLSNLAVHCFLALLRDEDDMIQILAIPAGMGYTLIEIGHSKFLSECVSWPPAT